MDTPDSQPSSRVRSTDVRIASAAATRIGHRRVNADASLLDDAGGFFAVADGMRDLPTSAVVSRAALGAVAEALPARWARRPYDDRCPDEARERLLMGLALAHGRLLDPGVPKGRRMGTTIAAVVVCGESLVGAHVGDSRIHLLQARDGRLVRLTHDHTVAGEARRQGMSTGDADQLPDANRLRQAVGASRRIEPSAFVRRWAAGDVLVLCTDGVSDHVGVEAMADIVLDAPALAEGAARIVGVAADVGGEDNGTVVLVHRVA